VKGESGEKRGEGLSVISYQGKIHAPCFMLDELEAENDQQRVTSNYQPLAISHAPS